jgi:hypothetical protein
MGFEQCWKQNDGQHSHACHVVPDAASSRANQQDVISGHDDMLP